MYLRKIEGTLDQFVMIAAWENQPEVLPYLTPCFSESEHIPVSAYHLMKSNRYRNMYFIVVDEVEIGFVDYMVNPEYITDKTYQTAWLSICIGKRSYWGKGYAKKAIEALEMIIWEHGIERIEIGVFGYNTRAKKLYESLGYQYFQMHENFTYFNGEWHNDYRLEKFHLGLERKNNC